MFVSCPKERRKRFMFQGFSQATVDFMWGIRFNNERTWFEAHKEEYKTVFYEPMRELADEVYARFMDRHSDLDLIRRVSRIYRDARRLHGRGPYKDRLWLSMERPADAWTAQPVFWFELEPEGYSYGVGYWMAPPLTMAKLRSRIERDPKPLEELARRLNRQKRFCLEGPEYKRPKGSVSPLLDPWYNKKSLSIGFDGPHDDLLWSHALADRLLADFQFLLPYYQYLLSLEGDPDPRE